MADGNIGSQRSVAIENVTPALAKSYLGVSDPEGRRRSQTHVEKLARQMVAGRFYVTSHGIGFSHEGVLIDGHHRLQAVMKSGVAVELVVVRGLDPLAKGVIDTDHRARRAGDVLTMAHGVADGDGVAAIIRLISAMADGASKTLSVPEIAAVYDRAHEHIDWALTLQADYRQLTNTIMRAALAIAHARDASKTEHFAAEVMTGSGEAGSPSRVLRDRMIASHGLASGGAGVRVSGVRLALSAVASHMRGDKKRKLFRDNDAASVEQFRVIVAKWFEGASR